MAFTSLILLILLMGCNYFCYPIEEDEQIVSGIYLERIKAQHAFIGCLEECNRNNRRCANKPIDECTPDDCVPICDEKYFFMDMIK